MTAPPRPPAAIVGRFTGLVLVLVVFVCVVMIGTAGYLKFELDKAQAVLAAPEAASGDQDIYDRLRRSLGYSGYIGLAQNFTATHDAAALPDMKAQLKTANDILQHLPERVPTETRRDLQALVNTFNAAELKAEKSTVDTATSFTLADMAPLYAALPVLDSRITAAAAVNRLTAQNHLQFWAMLLTLVSWCSLIIAAAMSVGIYLSLRDRNSAPMRALAQSVRNMAHGDLRTSIWGMERSDMVGELARTVDLARYHFSQLPDMSLLSDQGPVRLRFEGNTKSMFEAMMHLITRDSEQVREQAATLTEAVKKQQHAIQDMSGQIQSVLYNILERGQTGEAQVRQVVHDMLGTAQSLKNAQEHAADQLNRIVPYLQDRAKGLSEIIHITGKQVSQILQGLIVTERSLKNSAENSETAINKLSSTADDLGSRLFGAINLLQASGKVLAETTETTQSRLNEAIQNLHTGGVPAPVTETSPAAHETITRLETLIASLETAHNKLDEIVDEQNQAAKAQIELLTTHSNSLLAQSTTTVQTLSSAAEHLRDEQAKFDATIHQISVRLDTIGSRMEDKTSSFGSAAEDIYKAGSTTELLLSSLSSQIGQIAEKVSKLQQAPATPAGSDNNELLIEIRSGFETANRSLAQMREQMTNMVINVQAQIPAMPATSYEPMDNHWLEITTQIEATRQSLSQLVTQQIERLETRLSSLNSGGNTPTALPRDAQEHMEQQTQILTELVATLSILDEHMQQLKSDMQARS